MVRFLWIIAFCISGKMQAQTLPANKTQNNSYQDQFERLEELIDKYEYDHADSVVWASLKLVDLAAEQKNLSDLALAYKLLGNSYSSTGLHDKAIECYYNAIHYYDSLDDTSSVDNIASCYHNLGWVHTFLGEYDIGERLFKKALYSYALDDREDSITHAISFHALGSFYYIYMKQYDSGAYYLKKSISWRQDLKVPIETIAQGQLELVHALLLNQKLESAQNIIQEIKRHPEDSTSQYVKEYTTFVDGLYLHQTGQYSEALELFKPVYNWIIATGGQSAEIGLNALTQMIETARQGKMYEEAYQYLDLLRSLEKESIYKDRQRTTKALEIVNETARKENQISTQSEILDEQRVLLWTSSFAIIVFLVLAGVLYISWNKIKTKNLKIEILMRELHHRVKNNLQIISSLLGLQSMKLEDQTAKAAVSEGKQRIRAMSLIHQKLYQQDEVSTINLQEYMVALVNELANTFDFKKEGKLVIDVPPISMNSDTTLPLGLIVNELVTNALKYAYQNIDEPLLELKLVQDKNDFILSLRDNGVGLPENFNLEKTESFGLKLVNILMKQIKGRLELDQDNGLAYRIKFSV